MKKIFISVILSFFYIQNAYSVSINAAFTKVAIDENKYFIDFINPHITNFYTEEYFKIYKEAVIADFDANTYYLSGEYKKCFDKIIESQKLLRKLYYDILTKRYEVDAAAMLKMSGPIILLSKDKKAEYYLRTGYEEKTKAEIQRKIGFGVNQFMLSQKIKFYINAIDHIIRAKRYAILALVESTIPIIDKTDYKTQTFTEALNAENNIKALKEISNYEYLRNEIINNIAKKSLPTDYPFLLHHNDNYRMIHGNKKSVLNEIGDTINSSVKGFKNDQNNTTNIEEKSGVDDANGKNPIVNEDDKNAPADNTGN